VRSHFTFLILSARGHAHGIDGWRAGQRRAVDVGRG
jgi:hypothetical protein